MKYTVILVSLIRLTLVVLASDEPEPEARSESFSQSEDEANFDNQPAQGDVDLSEKSGYVSHMPHYVDQSQFNSGVSSNNVHIVSDNVQQASANTQIVSGQGHVQIGSNQQGHGTVILTGFGQESTAFGHGGSGLGQVSVGYGGSGYVQGGNIASGVAHISPGSGYSGSNNVHIVSGLGSVSSGNGYGGSNHGTQIVSGLGQIVTGQGISGQVHGTGIVSGHPQLVQSSVVSGHGSVAASQPGQGSVTVHAPVTEVIHQEHHVVYEVPKPGSSVVAVKPTEVTIEQSGAEDDKLSLFGVAKPFFALFTLIKITLKIALIALIIFLSKSLLATLPVMLIGALGVVGLCTFTPLCHMKIHGYGNTHHLRSLATPERLYTASKFLKSAIEKYQGVKSIAENEVRKRR